MISPYAVTMVFTHLCPEWLTMQLKRGKVIFMQEQLHKEI